MAFRISDLIITVSPAEALGTTPGSPRRPCDYKTTCFVCTLIQCSYQTRDFGNQELAERTSADIEALKAELRATLAALDVEQAALAAPAADRPRSVAEVDLVEDRLRRALDELSSERERLSQASPESE